jgi:hypothetical protein
LLKNSDIGAGGQQERHADRRGFMQSAGEVNNNGEQPGAAVNG